jgi:mannosyl-oligosaccharide glucosidase
MLGRSKFFIILVDFQVDSESISVGKAAVGSLLGGIGYFYGQSKIALSRTLNVSYFSLL